MTLLKDNDNQGIGKLNVFRPGAAKLDAVFKVEGYLDSCPPTSSSLMATCQSETGLSSDAKYAGLERDQTREHLNTLAHNH